MVVRNGVAACDMGNKVTNSLSQLEFCTTSSTKCGGRSRLCGCTHVTLLDASLGDATTPDGVFKALSGPAVKKSVSFCELSICRLS